MTKTIKTKKLFKNAADLIAEKINSLSKKRKPIILGIPGGRSVEGIFKLLKEKNIDWKKVHIFMVDEVDIGSRARAKKHVPGSLMHAGAVQVVFSNALIAEDHPIAQRVADGS